MPDYLRLPDPFYSYNKDEVAFAESSPWDSIRFFAIKVAACESRRAAPSQILSRNREKTLTCKKPNW